MQGANVVARELLKGHHFIVAALAANGTTTINGTEFIDRGYENIEKYHSLNAERKSDENNSGDSMDEK